MERPGFGAVAADGGRIGVVAPRTWEEMRSSIIGLLDRRTGHDLAWWNDQIAAVGPADEAALRAWLADRDVAGYPQMLLVMETFGYPGFMLASADELTEGQYADRPALRPILDAVLAAAASLGEVDVQARKTYTCRRRAATKLSNAKTGPGPQRNFIAVVKQKDPPMY